MSAFKFQGRNIFYTLDGQADNPPLVILNGIMMSHKSWEMFIPALKQHFHVIRLDMLDQGESDKMEGDYHQKLQADMLAGLIDHLNLDKVHIAGISYGGNVALQFARHYPEKIVKMVLFNAVAKTNAWLRDVGRAWNRIAKSRDGEAYYHAAIPLIYSPTFYTKRIEWMEARKETLIPVFSTPAFLDAMTRLTRSAESHDVSDALHEIKTPTLVVAADQDELTPPHEQRKIVTTMPNARLITFHETGHASMYERPELFTMTLIGYLLHPDDYAI